MVHRGTTMEAMATWTDGAAYAPIERPDGFATPEAAPLEVHPPLLAPTPGAIPPPQGFAPTAPQVPLDQIHTAAPATRNPSEPFHTASASLTAGPDAHVAGERDPRQPFTSYAVDTQELPPPTGAPLPPPSGAPLSVAPPPPGLAPSQAPQPGLADAPVWNPPGVPAGPDESTLKTLLGLAAACMGLGILLPGAAPWLVLVGGLLMLRTKPLSGHLGTAAIVAGIVLLVASLSDALLFGAVASLTSLVMAGLALYHLLRKPST